MTIDKSFISIGRTIPSYSNEAAYENITFNFKVCTILSHDSHLISSHLMTQLKAIKFSQMMLFCIFIFTPILTNGLNQLDQWLDSLVSHTHNIEKIPLEEVMAPVCRSFPMVASGKRICTQCRNLVPSELGKSPAAGIAKAPPQYSPAEGIPWTEVLACYIHYGVWPSDSCD